MSLKLFRYRQVPFICMKRSYSTIVPGEIPFNPSNRPTPTIAQTKLYETKPKVINPPDEVTEAFQHVVDTERPDLSKTALTQYLSSGLNMIKFYMNRSLPLDGWYGQVKRKQIDFIIAEKFTGRNLDDPNLQFEIDKSTKRETKLRSDRWNEMIYDNEAAYSYFIGTKAAYDFACLKYVLSEIKKRDKKFQPKTLLDFGSGLGTVTWAVKDVFGELYEVFNVDQSKHMNDFSRMIINKSKEDNDLPTGYSYRMNLPRDSSTKYDLVTSSFTLLDLPNERQRLTYVETLWHRVEEGGFLILTEVGTHHGYQTINEARELLIDLFNNSENSENKGHIFAPCPHEEICPRQFQKRPLCYSQVRFRNFPFKWLTRGQNEHIFSGRFSYIIAQKGTSRNESSDWPRIVEPYSSKKNCVTCRMCTPRGKLEEIIVTKSKHGNDLVRYCKSKQLGQQIKLSLNEKTATQPILDPQLEQVLDDPDHN